VARPKEVAVADSNEDRIETLAHKLMRAGDPAAETLESARRAARRMLEDSEERTFDPASYDPEDDGVIRRSSRETAATGDTVGGRRDSDGE
jgi:hypothetical protein